MNYTQQIDSTNLFKRNFGTCGIKVKISCPHCDGYIIGYIEDTIYSCLKHRDANIIVDVMK